MGNTGCGASMPSTSRQDTVATLEIGSKQVAGQPTPTDLGKSIARYLLIRRAYWLNGDFAKAFAYPCPVPTLPLGQVEIYSGGALIKSEPVVGAVVSRETYLTPDSEYFELAYGGSYTSYNKWLPDVDGTYGSNGGGVFWFTPDGEMHEWGGTDVFFRPSMGETLTPKQYVEFTTAPDWAEDMVKNNGQ